MMFKALTFEWSMESNVPEKRLPSRPSTSSKSVSAAETVANKITKSTTQ